ncbi:protein FAM177A1-like [Liolophura sinensis]|uniref:protein FAM177A1-like n=1 Tax=Liolophura sinensis TaxID=3198878 RepID=UPI00315923BB
MEGTYVETAHVKPEFTNISLETEKPRKHKKPPKRILHFSDGILEEYSSSDEEEEVVKQPVVDPKTLRWLPWMWYYFMHAATGTLSVADKCGEKLAWFFGITSPKYQAAIDEYYRLKEEEEKEMAEAQAHAFKPPESMEVVVTNDPKGDSDKQHEGTELEKY